MGRIVLPVCTRPVDRTVTLPGSKSLTNRALLAAAMADGDSRLDGILLADDTRRMIEVLQKLGVRVVVDAERRRAAVFGCAGHWPTDDADLHCGDAGTVARFITAAVAAGAGDFRLDGSPRLRERPIGPLVDALRDLGAMFGAEGHDDRLPLTVHARGLRGGRVRVDAADSSQYVSALLLAAPRASGDVMIEVVGELPSAPYVAMTLAVMAAFGIEAIEDGMKRFIVPAPQAYEARTYDVEPDASAATYFWAAAAATGGRMTVDGLGSGSVQGDVRFVDVLAAMGCRVEQAAKSTTVWGPAGGRLRGVDVDLNAMPDAAPTLAVLALFADGPTRIRGVANLRIKESDRLAALAEGLGRLGATVQLHEDGLTVTPPAEPRAAEIEAHSDHRMAMAFSIAGLRIDGVSIADAACVSKTFPEFFEVWRDLTVVATGR